MSAAALNVPMYWKAPSGPVTTRGLIRLGATFARLRVSRGYSQGALGDRIGLSQASISRFETGKQPGLGVRWLARMMLVLEVSADELESHLQPPEPPFIDPLD